LVLGLYKYVDVNGTDYSAKVMSSDANRKLSDVGTCDIVLNNKGGQYKTTFSEMQRVAVAQGRAAFNAHSDFFTGMDGAAPNAAKWTTQKSDANQKVEISGNKLMTQTIGAVAGNYARAHTAAAVAPPYTLIVWFKTDVVTHAYAAHCLVGGAYWRFHVDDSMFYLGTIQGGGYAERASGGTAGANSWYRLVIKVSSYTSVSATVYDVCGNSLFASGAVACDAFSGGDCCIYLGVHNEDAAALQTYWIGFLVTSSVTYTPDWVFGGVINKIEFTENPDMITLHCVNDAWELEKQYDETYGRATATFTPSYGATDDVDALTGALLPSGWNYHVPDCAIHDKQVISINTRRIYALNELLDLTPYLGWFVLPFKCLVWVMPDTDITPDSITEDTGGWTTVGAGTIKGTDASYNIDGAKDLYITSVNAEPIAAYHATNFSALSYRFLIMYYGADAGMTPGTTVIRIYTDTAAPKYWQFSLPDTPNTLSTRENMVHLVLRLPDSIGTHGWTATGGPTVNDSIIRFYIGGTVLIAAAGYLDWDVLYFAAAKRLTSKYTLPARIFGNRTIDADQYTRAIVAGSGITTQVADDTTMQASLGLRETLINDQSITTEEPALAQARTLLNLQGWDDTADPITYSFVNPGDMYNVMLGDTVTVTVANMNLSSATRTIIARRDTLDGNGWITSLTLSGDPTKDRIENLLTMAKRKRY
jgi:hypothetical protein